MIKLNTTYMGLELNNPIIVGSSRLTSTLDGLKKCEDAGAGAVVLKSLFEEQINSDSHTMLGAVDDYYSHADAYDFFENKSKDYYIDSYLTLLEEAKQALSIPVIASVNCINPGSWIDYAHRFQELQADALELNVFIVPSNVSDTSDAIEERYFELIKKLKKKITIPTAIKLGSHFSGMANVLKHFDTLGVAGLVLFNRFYKTDIDIENLSLKAGSIISVPEEAATSLQWIALMSGELSCDLCGATGIHSGEMVIKQLLAGASAVQICSAIMKQGFSSINEMNTTLLHWMEKKNYSTLDDFVGILCQESSQHPEVWERSQYIKAVCGIS